MSESAALSRDEQAIGSQEEAMGAQINGRLKDMHTSMPAIVASFDAAKQTCSLQPTIQRVFGDTPVNLPLCVDCPVIFPQGGGFVLTFPLAPGDEVLMLVAERAIDNWYAAGGTQTPAEYRMHDLSDGFALAGISNQTRNIPDLNTDAIELRTRSGDARVILATDGTITNSNPGGNTVLSADGRFTINAPAGLFVNAPLQTNSGSVAVAGSITFGGTATGVGNISTSGSVSGSTNVFAAGKGLAGHTHGGVDTGPNSTGPNQ